MKLICVTLAVVSTCSSAASAFVPTTTGAITRPSPIAIKAVSEDASAIDHGDRGDTFHHNDALEEMYTAVAGIKEEKAEVDLGDYEQDMLHSKAELENLMHTKAFRHALDSEDTYNAPTNDKMPTSSMASQGKVLDKGVSHFEFAALKQKKALDKLMTSKLQGVDKSHDDDHSVHHFELSLLESHAALDKLMDEGSFKESLDSDAELIDQLNQESLKKRVQIDDHMESRGYPKAAESPDPSSQHFEYASLKKKRALDDLMHSKGFRHNLDVDETTTDDEDSEPHFMSSLAKTKAALGAVMTGEAFRQSLESDVELGIAGVDASYNVPKTHNDIVGHFEFATLKKRAALDKLARSRELCM